MKIEGGGKSFQGDRGSNHLRATLTSLFIGGSDTTVHTINWAVYYLAKHPEVQAKVQSEIDTVLGGRIPNLSDRFLACRHHLYTETSPLRPKMPYSEAFIDEVQRHAVVGFAGIPRMTTEDVEIGPYFIPSRTRIIPFYHDILRDPAFWGEDTASFKPERFLGENGEKITFDRNIPFGTGKRSCLGKLFAMSQVCNVEW